MRILNILLVLLWPISTSAQSIPLFMTNAANSFNINVTLMYAICMQESKCKPSAINHHDANKRQKSLGIRSKSYGMFQIKYSTAQGLGFKGDRAALLKPNVNAWYAAKLLRNLYDKYHDTPSVISAYNSSGKPIKGNMSYVHKVLENFIRFNLDKN